MDDLIFACDVNLGFPTDDPEWAAFFRDHGWRTVNYDDMGELTATLKAHVPAAAFMPAANYFYLKDDPLYAGLASALAERTGHTTVTSVLIAPRTSNARSVMDFEASGWATSIRTARPAISLPPSCWPNTTCRFGHSSPRSNPSAPGNDRSTPFSPVASMQPWSKRAFWLDKPANQAQTKIIGSVDGLPGPVIVLAKTVDPAFASAFLAKLVACRTAALAQPFLGYTGYCRDAVQPFFDRSERAFAVAAG